MSGETASGTAHTRPVQAGSLKKGSYCLLKGKPCKIVDYSTSKTGKHGHAKANITGTDIFTGKKYEDMCPTSHNMEEPVVKKEEFQLIDIQDDGFLSLMDTQGETKEDLKFPTDTDDDKTMTEKIKTKFDDGSDINVVVQSAMGIEKIVDYKEVSG
jgi:translation initiation factor 5A